MKYHEAGIPVIPLSGKVPLVSEWQIWSEREQTTDEVEWLVDHFPNANIGAVLGLWASALDIDTDNEHVLKAIPYTPYRRRGKKGFVYLYRANTMTNTPGTQTPIEFLNRGRQIVLPPSVHPDTGEPYKWVGEEDVLNRESLPVFTPANLETIQRICQRAGISTPPRTRTVDGETRVSLTDTGRNNRLTRIAYAMACDEVPEDEAIPRLLELDEKEHEVPWFSDPKEPHRGKSPKMIAKRMYSRAVKAATKRGDLNGPPLVLSFTSKQPAILPGIPKPRGIIRLFQDYCNATAFGNQDALGLSGGIALMAAIASNRFRTKAGAFDVWPNMYVMNLASSGFGKETPQRALDEVLMGSGLLGSSTYKSGSSIIMGLPEQPTRLDIIDECSMILKAMAAREDYKSDMVDVLSMLYSRSNSYFHGFTSKGDGKNFGACWNPCVNILGSTTPAGFRSSVNRDMAAKGLLPRFLIFWQRDIGEFKRDQDPETAARIMKEIKRLTGIYLGTPLNEIPVQRNLLDPATENMVRYDPELIPMTDGAQRALSDLQERYFNEGKADPEGFESAFKNRFAQHTAKIALLDTLGLGLAEIGVDSVEWAHSVVEWQWQTVKELYELASAENDHDKDVKRVFHYIKQHGTVKRTKLTREFPGIYGKRLDEILKQLDNGEMIEVGVEANNGKRGPKSQILKAIK